jgi:hypothetical protein
MQNQAPVARSPPAPRFSIEPPGRTAAAAGKRKANPRGGWGFGAGLLGFWGFKIKQMELLTQTTAKQFAVRVRRSMIF